MTNTFTKGGSTLNQFGEQAATIPRGAQMGLPAGLVMLTGSGAPTDGTTGDNVAGPGSVYIDTDTGNWYLQTAVITSPAWKLVTIAA